MFFLGAQTPVYGRDSPSQPGQVPYVRGTPVAGSIPTSSSQPTAPQDPQLPTQPGQVPYVRGTPVAGSIPTSPSQPTAPQDPQLPQVPAGARATSPHVPQQQTTAAEVCSLN